MQKFHKEIKDQIQYEFTVYSKTTLPTKWYAGNSEYYTGVVCHVIMDNDDQAWIGISVCSVKDVFNKKIGRAIARGRAEKVLTGRYAQVGCSIVTPLGKRINGTRLYAGSGE